MEYRTGDIVLSISNPLNKKVEIIGPVMFENDTSEIQFYVIEYEKGNRKLRIHVYKEMIEFIMRKIV